MKKQNVQTEVIARPPAWLDDAEPGMSTLLERAHATLSLGGIDAPVWDYGTGRKLLRATVTVYRRLSGIRRHRYVGVAWFAECNTGEGDWVTRPHHKLACRALAIALEMAFPEMHCWETDVE
jgi:hypothetical protein